MDCHWIARDEVFERYLRDGLDPEERDAFEEHYFACDACFDKVQTYRALVAELPNAVRAPQFAPRGVRKWWWAAVPAAALLLLIAAVALRFEPGAPGAPKSPAPVSAAREARGAPPAPAVTAPPPAVPASPERTTRPPVVALSVLARVEPPLYLPVALRGPQDEAAEKFETAMARYAEGDYAGAIPALGEAARLKPGAAQYKFFLSICLLLTNQVDPAIAGLQDTVALGDTAYLEESHFYLAKARLRQGDIRAARQELQMAIVRGGPLQADARKLLGQLDALTLGKDRPPGK